MRHAILGIGLVLALGGPVAAQYPTQPFPGSGSGVTQPGFSGAGQANPNLMPNIYNPQTQPLSPYLNLNRGGNPATNYYYGVRPGTLGGAGRNFNGAPFMAGGGNRTLFFPQYTSGTDPLVATPTEGYVLPPAGHPVVFNNTLGFFPGAGGQAGGSRSGLAGQGARPPARR